MKQYSRTNHEVESLTEGVLSGDRITLAQAITLVESNLDSDKQPAASLLEKILPKSGNALRIGITGVPGVGKSTFIETFGKYLVNEGRRLAVLTIDPTSPLTRGSILGDKTRMEELSKHPMAFIRPSSSGTSIGGVAYKTREAMFLCEAAGYDVIIVETVGVGQSEISVSNMVDFFLLLMLAGAGDALQGMKKGIIEISDAIVITKADGTNVKNAVEAQSVYQQALHLFSTPESGWHPTVLVTSSITGEGIKEIWDMISKHHDHVKSSGYLNKNRSRQNVAWFHDRFIQLLNKDIHQFKEVEIAQKKLEAEVSNSTISSEAAARQLLDTYHKVLKRKNP